MCSTLARELDSFPEKTIVFPAMDVSVETIDAGVSEEIDDAGASEEAVDAGPSDDVDAARFRVRVPRVDVGMLSSTGAAVVATALSPRVEVLLLLVACI